jgi:predicted transcriptional regulator
MYTYIVERTQIYLSTAQAAALDREARRTGTTRSHLIREAIEAHYGTAGADPDGVTRALTATAGLWKDRTEPATEYVDRFRSGRRLRDVNARPRPARPRTARPTGGDR